MGKKSRLISRLNYQLSSYLLITFYAEVSMLKIALSQTKIKNFIFDVFSVNDLCDFITKELEILFKQFSRNILKTNKYTKI